MQRFTIPGRLEGLNAVIAANRSNKFIGAKVKRESTTLCAMAIRAAKLRKVEHYPLTVCIDWVEPNNRRDPDNVASAKKFVFDALQETGIIENDGQRQIRSLVDTFSVDRKNPRVVVSLYECGEPVL